MNSYENLKEKLRSAESGRKYLQDEIKCLEMDLEVSEARRHFAMKPRYAMGTLLFLMGMLSGLTLVFIMLIIKSFLNIPTA